MENTLQFDLNELVSKEIGAKITQLEKQKENLTNQNILLQGKISDLSARVENAKLPLAFLEMIRGAFNAIEADPRDKDDYHKHKNQKQFDFIENIMLNVFGIEKESQGWLSYRGDGNLYNYLAVNYYKSKQHLMGLLELLSDDPKHKTGIQFIRSFRMPYDWSKEEVISFLKDPGSCTNGSYIGISNFWFERGCGRNNCPYNLVLMSPFIVEDDVWDVLINQITIGLSNSTYFYSVYNYHKLSDERIKQLGDILIDKIDKKKSMVDYECPKAFLTNNFVNLSDKVLDFFYEQISDDNQFKTFNWEKFPVRYQHKYLLSKNIEDVLKIIGGYSCRWTIEEKESFLKAYFNK